VSTGHRRKGRGVPRWSALAALGALVLAVGDPALAAIDAPVTFAGGLPCPHREPCDRVRVTLTLLPDGTFFLRQVHIEELTRPYLDFGRYAVLEDGRVLSLRGRAEETLAFAVEGGRSLRLLDGDEGAPLTLTRAVALDPFDDRLVLTGLYSLVSDTGIFRECTSGLLLPLVPGAEATTLARAWERSPTAAHAPVMARVVARFDLRPGPGGAGTFAALVVERLEETRPYFTCAAAPPPPPRPALTGR
jgi:hypothetical protein